MDTNIELGEVPTVANSPELRFTLQAARAWGCSPSKFLGREITTRILYDRDLFGTVVAISHTQEAEWTDEDRRLALELQEYEAGLCPGCSTPMSETTDPANEYRYEAKLPLRCHRCTTSERAMKQYEENEAPSALFLPIVLRGTQE
jgi:hypothetical protein